jgi:uncharacterized RDD family membrane protein YckC
VNHAFGPERRPAGFWIRGLAAFLDVVVLFVVNWSLAVIGRGLAGPGAEHAGVIGFAVLLFTIVFAGLYTTVLHALGGQTLGKLATRIRVVGADRDEVGAGAAFLRFLAYFVSAFPFFMGFVMAGLRSDKRALHDLLAGTRVERLPAPAAAPAPAVDEARAPGEATPPGGSGPPGAV